MKTEISCKSHHWIAEMTLLISEKTYWKVDSLSRDNEVGCIFVLIQFKLIHSIMKILNEYVLYWCFKVHEIKIVTFT